MPETINFSSAERVRQFMFYPDGFHCRHTESKFSTNKKPSADEWKQKETV